MDIATLVDARTTLDLALIDTPAESPPMVRYTVETRSIVSGGVARSFVAATPMPASPSPALVIALHGDEGNGTSLRAAFPIEAETVGAAIVLYPNAPGGTFEYYTYEGRQREAQFIRDLITDAVGHHGVDRRRVFLAAFSGGATMANALNCGLGPAVIHGVAIQSGTLYPTTSATQPARADFS